MTVPAHLLLSSRTGFAPGPSTDASSVRVPSVRRTCPSPCARPLVPTRGVDSNRLPACGGFAAALPVPLCSLQKYFINEAALIAA